MSNNILNRLKRNKGQINALVRLIEEQEDCEKILIQFQASQSALNNAFALFLEENISECLKNKDEKVIKKLLPLILKR